MLYSRVLTAVLLLELGTGNASGSLIKNLATGLNSSGTLQTSGDSVDANWTYQDPAASPTTGSAKVVTPASADWGPQWIGNGPLSDWIAPNPDTTNNGPAPYSFTTTFNLTGYDLSSVVISGGWAVDDAGTLALNGTVISASMGNGAYCCITSFAGTLLSAATLNQGLNTLTITLTGSDQHLEGVRLEGSVTGTPASGIPEPTTWTLFGLGAMSVAVLRRRKEKRPEPSRLLELSFSANKELAWAAVVALRHVVHAAVREAAFRLTSNRLVGREYAIAMLSENWEPDDHQVVLSWFDRESDRSLRHRMQIDLQKFWERHPQPKSELRMLELLYEKGPCSFCRHHVVRRMIELDELPAALRAECAYDANEDVRELVGAPPTSE